ncbi:hypothetical protein CRM22_002361 [Opisthorchis felineus]|uniref:Sfi1 spindle body domain-containing protein n=1 Tax=Opisthorchis felineus TaxID=147828 RepID=A0A4S2M6E1_OPIFE|nr:hypothetical protein CRM22_002361 [Opisthorchis felineus]
MVSTKTTHLSEMKNMRHRVCVPTSQLPDRLGNKYSPSCYAPVDRVKKNDVYSEARNVLTQWAAARIVDADEEEYTNILNNVINIPNQTNTKHQWSELNEEISEFSGKIRKSSDAEKRTCLCGSSRTGTRETVKEKPPQNMLDRMLLRFEESRARRELRRQEEEQRARDVLLQREAELEAAELVQMEQQSADRLKERLRQEEEMLRIRRMMNLGNETTPTERGCHNEEGVSDNSTVQSIVDADKEIRQSCGVHWCQEITAVYSKSKMVRRPKGETSAVEFHQNFLKCQSFRIWKANVRRKKAHRILAEREELRRQKESEFLDRLHSWASTPRSHRGDGVQTHDFDDMDLTKIKPESTQQNDRRSADERSKLSSTLCQQRQKIAEQHREIEKLKLEKRQAELLLEAKERMLRERSLIQARKGPVRQVPPPKPGTIESRKHQSLTYNSAASSPRPCDTDLASSRSIPKATEIFCEQTGKGENDTTMVTKTVQKNQFLIRMEEQATKRAVLRAEREERRRQAEEKKREENARQLEEQARRLREEKQALLQARRTKQLEEERKRKRQEQRMMRQREIEEMTARHRNGQLMRYCGWLPWRRYTCSHRASMEIARKHNRYQLQRTVFQAWSGYVRQKREQILSLIEKVRNETLIRSFFQRLHLVIQKTRETENQAFAWYEQQLMRRILSGWSTHVTSLQIWEWKLEDVARAHREDVLKRTVLSTWITIPSLMREERERERRRELLRDKLRDLVPDFNPPQLKE